jgi:aminomethyltransferase
MVPFAGYEMPVQYTGVNKEHQIVREGVGVFDVSHMGEFFVRGEGALDLLQYVTSNDVSKLVPGKIQYSCFPNGKGGIVDDLLVYCLGENSYMLVVNASNIEKDWNWIEEHNSFNASLDDKSESISLFAVQGPKAALALQVLTEIDLANMVYYTFERGTFAGVNDVIVSATGYTGSGGFEIYVPNNKAEHVWDAIMEAGKEYGIEPIGLAARDTLRLEMGFCLYGNDIDDTTSPLEAGLGWITKFTKNFIDAEFLSQQKAQGVDRKLIGFEMIDRGIPRKSYHLFSPGGSPIGVVTSGTQSPSLGKAIGMGYIQKDFAAPDTEILVEIRNKRLKAKVVKLPFYKP